MGSRRGGGGGDGGGGGVISDGAGKPLDFAAGRFLDVEKGIVASATPELHAELLAAVAARRP